MVLEGSLLYVEIYRKGFRIHTCIYILEPFFPIKCAIKWSGFEGVCRVFKYDKTLIVYLIMKKTFKLRQNFIRLITTNIHSVVLCCLILYLTEIFDSCRAYPIFLERYANIRLNPCLTHLVVYGAPKWTFPATFI